MSARTVTVHLKQRHDDRFDIHFDESAQSSSSSVQQFCAAVGIDLADSLLSTLRKVEQSSAPLACMVVAEIGKNAERQIRVLNMAVSLHLGVLASQLVFLDRLVDEFQTLSTVTQSVRQGIPVDVTVYDANGKRLRR